MNTMTNEFVIGESVSEIPGGNSRRGKYGAVYDAVIAAAPDWIPVTCETREQAHLLRMAASHEGHETRQRLCVAYIRVKLPMEDER